MEKFVKIKINGQKIKANSGQTILEVARQNNIFVPSLCYHPDFCAKANCRVCLVEILGAPKLVTACSTLVKDGLEILTDSPLVQKTRNLNVELLFAEHIEKCPTCIQRFNCDLLNLAKRYQIKITRFPNRKRQRQIYKFANAVEIDGTQCIDCRNCVDACSKLQNINYLEIAGKGIHQEIVPTKDKFVDCIYCGQCALHCPVTAAQEHYDCAEVEAALALAKKNKNKIVVAEFAPSVRVTIGEEFGLPYGEEATGRTVAGLKRLGFSHVFDVNFGADITTIVEANELLARLGGKKSPRPMLTSCCPGWVKYLEFYHPELIPNLTSARSPHIDLAGIIKTYWAQKMKVDPKNIIVVSIMPCTAKKFEISRSELKLNGMQLADYALTTREFAYLLKKNKIDFAKLKPEVGDEILNEGTGAAVIFGSSGGVMESALRTASVFACQKSPALSCPGRLEFKEVRGLKSLKEATFDIAGKKVRVAVVNGIAQFDQIAAHLKKYDYIEVMACVGGCIGGGGQPIPTTPEIRKKRVAGLYAIDKNKTIRKAHENQDALKVLEWLKDNKLDHKILHTKYKKRTR